MLFAYCALLIGLLMVIRGTRFAVPRLMLRMRYTLVLTLCIQAGLRWLMSTQNLSGGVTASLWSGCSLAIAGIALLNSDVAGRHVVAMGLASNALVVSANGGMPVHLAGGGPVELTGFYVLADSSTVAAWMGDVLPDPTGLWLVSLGDLMIVIGAATAVVAAIPMIAGEVDSSLDCQGK